MKFVTPSSPDTQREVLGRAARMLASASDFRETLRHTIEACLPSLGDFGFFDVIHGDEVIRTVAAHEAPDIEALLAPTQWVRQDRDDLNLCALSTGDAALHGDITDAWYRRVAANDGHMAMMRELGFCSLLTVPVRYRAELVGALTLFMGRSRRQHMAEDLMFASEIAGLAAPVVVNARLVEQHRRSEAALRRSEERLRMAVEAGHVGIWDWDIVHNKVEWSDRVYELHEIPRDQDPGGLETFRSHVHPDDLAHVEQSLTAALAGGPPYATEYRLVFPGGRTRWLATQSHIVRDANGAPVRMVGGCTDVTERMELLAAERSARSAAEMAQRRLELLARAGEVLSRSLDPDVTLQTIGDAIVPAIADWCRIDLLDDQGVLQRRLAHHADPEQARRALELARELRASPATQGSMASVVRTGQDTWGSFADVSDDPALEHYTRTFGMHAYGIVPLIARGRTIGAMAVIQSASGRVLDADDRSLVIELAHRAALALDNARLYSATESANRAKDEFLAMLGHELRNPLAPIAAALELMALREPHAHQQERSIIGRQVSHLSRLIDDLLDVSRITRGKVQLVREPVDLRKVVGQALELTRPLFEKRPHGIDVSMPEQPAFADGDAVRLAQVVSNLLTNAAKFTPPDGRVRLSLDQDEGWLRLAVEDNGSGIDTALLPRVFDLFVQGEQAIDRRAGGLGLGLAIVRTLVQMHGGEVAVHSDGPGKGAKFTVRLPPTEAVPAPTTSQASMQPQLARSGRVLIVDDNVDAAETLSELLRLAGYETECAHHARDAMAALPVFRPAVALLDIGLPQVDGYELAGMMRASAPGVRIVALTGYGRDNDREKALRAGFDDHLVKPVSVDRLMSALQALSSPALP